MKAWTRLAVGMLMAAVLAVTPATGATAAAPGGGATPDYISICTHPIFKVLCFG